MILSKTTKKGVAQLCSHLPALPPTLKSLPVLSLRDPKAEECHSRCRLLKTALAARVAQREPLVKRHDRKGRGYFWNYHDKRRNEKHPAGLATRKREEVAREKKSFPGVFAKEL